MRSTQKILAFADWDNTQCSAKSFNRKLEWNRLRDYLANPQEGRELIEMVIYVGMPPDSFSRISPDRSRQHF